VPLKQAEDVLTMVGDPSEGAPVTVRERPPVEPKRDEWRERPPAEALRHDQPVRPERRQAPASVVEGEDEGRWRGRAA